VVKLQTRLDNEAVDLAKGRTQMPAAVVRLVRIVPPARLDLINEVLVAVGRRDLASTLDWPPVSLVHELIYRVGRVHRGEVRLRGQNGEVVDVVRYTDKLGHDRRMYRLHRHGVFVGEYKTPEELAKVVDLTTLVEDENGPRTG
jgi:hypothetical protein